MKCPQMFPGIKLFYIACLMMCLSVSETTADEFVKIFNGKDLSGWSGDKELWTVQDGAITGITSKDSPLEYNKFIVWDGKVSDFVFRAEFRLIGDNNSGVQYRSERFGEANAFRVRGYQADIHGNPAYTGMLYDEGGRGVVAQRGQKVVVDNASKVAIVGKTGDVPQEDLTKWTRIEIKAVGNQLVHRINGKITVDITDNDEKNREFEGILALQIHRGKPMKIQFRNLQINDLSEAKK